MYEGGLVTLRFKDTETLLATSLSQIDVELQEERILIKNKEKGEILGELEEVIGIETDELLQFFQPKKEE